MKIQISIDSCTERLIDGENILVAAGSVLLAASPFVTWIRVFLLGDLDLDRRALRHISAVTGVIFGLIGGDLAIGDLRAVKQTSGFAGVGLGPYMLVAGCALLVITPLVRQLAEPAPKGPPSRFRPPSWVFSRLVLF